ncbi:MAG: hypothetical protein OXH63_24380 [Gemmatimonadetes bacterium]|nr:hypothetical protein [Gemmatimonadota bacterium]
MGSRLQCPWPGGGSRHRIVADFSRGTLTSDAGTRFTALMYSVIGTFNLYSIDMLRWLETWLGTCTENGGRQLEDLSP